MASTGEKADGGRGEPAPDGAGGERTSTTSGPPATLEEWLRDPEAEVVRRIHDALHDGVSPLFITGAAGTGKSTLLQLIAAESPDSPVLAPTGVAALRAGGQTVHSFFRLQRGVQLPGDDGVTRPLDLYRSISTMIVDEVSMIRADVLDRIDGILKAARNSDEPYGGVQMVFVGDLLQLPPVVDRKDRPLLRRMGYAGPHFFEAHVMNAVPVATFALDRVHRQRARSFVAILNAIRVGHITPELLSRLNRRVFPRSVVEGKGALILTTRRLQADVANEQRLNALQAPETTYVGKVQGDFPTRQLPAPMQLRLRPGAHVMIVRNDRDGRWVNGTIGVVVQCRPAAVMVDRLDGRPPCTVEPVGWERCAYRYDARTHRVERPVIGRYVQLPLVLGWAATAHKAQGLSLDRVHVDLGRGAFAAGQTYVALSRARTEQGLTLERPVRPADLIVDRRAIAFLQRQVDRRAA